MGAGIAPKERSKEAHDTELIALRTAYFDLDTDRNICLVCKSSAKRGSHSHYSWLSLTSIKNVIVSQRHAKLRAKESLGGFLATMNRWLRA